MTEISDASIVDVMLAAAGITVSAKERQRLTDMYGMHRPGIAAMYALPDVRYESPALVFQAAPNLDTWGDR